MQLNNNVINDFDRIAQVIRITGGITLSQLSEISGLETTTIQNWVKRGWVEAPKNRKYGEQSVARVLLISLLRGTMQLSGIVELMAYVNGRVDDRSDDAIPDGELYGMLCQVVNRINGTTDFSIAKIDDMVDAELINYAEPFPGGYEKLKNTLKIMVTAYVSSVLKRQAEIMFDKIIKKQ